MRKPFKKLSLIFAIALISSHGVSQSNEIIIKFIGNCGLYMTDGNLSIYTDFPYKSGAHGYMEYDKSELNSIKENSIFIFTHKHADHYSSKNLKKILKSKNGKKYGSWNISELENLAKTIPDFNIKAFKTKHRFSLNHYSYLITWHNKNIFLSGDTENAETIGNMKNLDWAFVPAWLSKDANERNIKVDSKMIGIYHIGPGDKITTKDKKILLLDKQGEVISIKY